MTQNADLSQSVITSYLTNNDEENKSLNEGNEEIDDDLLLEDNVTGSFGLVDNLNPLASEDSFLLNDNEIPLKKLDLDLDLDSDQNLENGYSTIAGI